MNLSAGLPGGQASINPMLTFNKTEAQACQAHALRVAGRRRRDEPYAPDAQAACDRQLGPAAGACWAGRIASRPLALSGAAAFLPASGPAGHSGYTPLTLQKLVQTVVAAHLGFALFEAELGCQLALQLPLGIMPAVRLRQQAQPTAKLNPWARAGGISCRRPVQQCSPIQPEGLRIAPACRRPALGTKCS